MCEERAHPSQRYRARVLVGRMGTGKAAATRVPEFFHVTAPTLDEVLALRDSSIQSYLNPKKRKRQQLRDIDECLADQPCRARPMRSAAPRDLWVPPLKMGNINVHAGPGRGRKYEPARSLHQQIQEAVIMPPANGEEGSWFRRMQLSQKWKSERMAQLERQVEELLLINEEQSKTIGALRTRVSVPIYSHVLSPMPHLTQWRVALALWWGVASLLLFYKSPCHYASIHS